MRQGKRWAAVCVTLTMVTGGLAVVALVGSDVGATTATTTVTVSATLPIAARSYANDPVNCPAGDVAIGGGGTVSGGGGVTSNGPMLDGQFLSVKADGTYGASDLTGWNVSGATGSTGGSVTTTAICAQTGGSLPSTFTALVTSEAVAAGDSVSLTQSCRGGEAVGGGADANDSLNVAVDVSDPTLFTTGGDMASIDVLPGTYGASDGWEAYFDNGASAGRIVKVAAICIGMTGHGDLSTVVAASPGTGSSSVACASGDEVTAGGGANATGAVSATSPTGMTGGGPATGWLTTGAGDNTEAVVVCLTPSASTTTTTTTPTTTTTTTPGSGKVVRLAGATRIGTAVAISQNRFAAAGSAKAVVLARSDPGQFADALVGAALAAAKQAPLLLTPGTALDPATLSEIQRVLPSGATVYMLGGTGALAPAVGATLSSAGYTVVRYGGVDRFDTAAIVADQGLGDPTTVFEATGLDFPDALSAGAAATFTGGAVLLTNGSVQASETASYLTAHPPTNLRYAVGGQAAAADPSADAIVGADRYATAADVAQQVFTSPPSNPLVPPSPTKFGAALGTNYPDALAGAAHIGGLHGPLLLVEAAGPLPAPTATYLAGVKSRLAGGFVYGGTSAVGDDVLGELNAAIS